MKFTLLLLLLAACFVLPACTTTHTLRNDESALTAFTQEHGGDEVSLYFSDGRRADAIAVPFALDSTSWVNRQTGRYHVTATRDIIRVEEFSRWRGASA